MNEPIELLPPETPSSSPAPVMTPREIVSELDRYIVGQKDAKRAVAIALRNRWRRQLVPDDLREEIAPKNIIMIGPTGVGKTEISRRLAKLAQAPFIKVEASKFTEVGYVGRDVESIIRDLTDLAVNMVKEEEKQSVEIRAREVAEERILDLLLPPSATEPQAIDAGRVQGTRDKLKKMLREGKMDDRFVDIEITQSAMPMIEVLTPQGMEGMEFNLKEMFSNLLPKKSKKKTVKIPEGLEILTQEEAAKLIDMDKVIGEAVRRVEQSGIVFLDEIDKIAGRESSRRTRCFPGRRPARSAADRRRLDGQHKIRNGQNRPYSIRRVRRFSFREALGSYSGVSGPFPDPRRAQLVGKAGFRPDTDGAEERADQSVCALLKTEGVDLEFAEDAIQEIARIAADVNERTENIGARRLHTVLERLLDEISFDAPEMHAKSVRIDAQYVRERLSPILKNEDLSRYIL